MKMRQIATYDGVIPADACNLHFLTSFACELSMTAAFEGSQHLAQGAALIVEDNPIIAFDAKMMLEELGFSPVTVLTGGIHLDNQEANAVYQFVILDLNLDDEERLNFALRLSNAGAPLVFASGCHDLYSMPDAFKNHAVLMKPYTKEQISALMTLPA